MQGCETRVIGATKYHEFERNCQNFERASTTVNRGFIQLTSAWVVLSFLGLERKKQPPRWQALHLSDNNGSIGCNRGLFVFGPPSGRHSTPILSLLCQPGTTSYEGRPPNHRAQAECLKRGMAMSAIGCPNTTEATPVHTTMRKGRNKNANSFRPWWPGRINLTSKVAPTPIRLSVNNSFRAR